MIHSCIWLYIYIPQVFANGCKENNSCVKYVIKCATFLNAKYLFTLIILGQDVGVDTINYA